MSEACYNPKYLVLHFMNGQLCSTKVTHSWRGAVMSKQNHERPFNAKTLKEVFGYTDQQIALHRAQYNAASRILPIDAILALKGLEKPDTELSETDLALLRRMGIE